jgi:bifunctional UDP-N-acetylglucosamine pyrophosphorylase / glucosamine-1-phosphate N-acetyltransferase
VVDAVPPEDVLSINTPEELHRVDGILRKRLSGEGRPLAAAGIAREKP